MGGERVWMNPYEIITAQEISKRKEIDAETVNSLAEGDA